MRERAHPKFFWVDAGIARAAAGLLRDPLDRAWKGTALESLIYHELRVYNSAAGKHRQLLHYRTAARVEIDFLIETQKRLSGRAPHVVCVEVKLSTRWERRYEGAMRGLTKLGGIVVDKMIGVYTGERSYHVNGLDVWPVEVFLEKLHQGEIY